MQESYISLDPDNAESMSSQQRARVFKQRKFEAQGGQAGNMLAQNMQLTAILVSYTVMRHKGFRFMPFGVKKLPALGGLYLVGGIGYFCGKIYSRRVIGDTQQFQHLIMNESAIKNGTMSFDASASL